MLFLFLFLLLLLLLLLIMRGLRANGLRELAHDLECTLGRVLSRVVDVLTIVPVAGRDGVAVDIDAAAPSGATACDGSSQCRRPQGHASRSPRRSDITCHTGVLSP